MAFRFGYVLAVLGSAVVLSGQPGTSEESVPCGVHPLDTDWSLEAPADAGFDPAVLCALTDYDYPLFKEHETNVHAIVVSREGKLVFESYRTGEDQTLGDIDLGVVTHAPDLPHDVRSVTKSVVSLLVGIAIDRELIVGVDAPVFSFFPEYAGLAPGKDGITLQHLLTMTSGLAWNETDYPYAHPSNTYRQMADSDEPYRYVLGQAVASPPGKRWTYSSGDTALLGAVLQKVSGQSLEEFAREVLFEPLGITDVEWSAMQPSGETSAGAGLRLRPRDMAKIGQLVLAGGTWEGRQIVSERWTAESTAAQVQRYPGGYGYQWWTDTSHIGDREIAWIAAMGRGGQRIFIVPDYDLVVAITAGLYADNAQDAVALDILDNYVLAAIRE